jgi:hypothetical protein
MLCSEVQYMFIEYCTIVRLSYVEFQHLAGLNYRRFGFQPPEMYPGFLLLEEWKGRYFMK